MQDTVDEIKASLVVPRLTASVPREQPATTGSPIDPLPQVIGADGKSSRPPFKKSVVEIIRTRWTQYPLSPEMGYTNLGYWAKELVKDLNHGSFQDSSKGRAWSNLHPVTKGIYVSSLTSQANEQFLQIQQCKND
ncbi:hypothetical protein [Absidia glauca]|uniref:Uncharacterized protein n=1 Tax=Absidia glauca TaxID=4829 RepID=A0A163J938_ABSGL|nr:hypothetical protein [Absidia glauca]